MFNSAIRTKIKAVQKVYPKYSATAHSLAERTALTGIKRTAEAERLISGLKPRRSENRACPCRYTVRLTESLSRKFNACRGDTTMQDALTEGVELYILKQSGKFHTVEDSMEAVRRLSRNVDAATFDNPAALKQAFASTLEQVEKEKAVASVTAENDGAEENNLLLLCTPPEANVNEKL